MSKFCIDLKGMMLPDAIAAVVEAWYEIQNVDFDYSRKYYNIKELQKVLDRSRASIYRILNIEKNILNPPFNSQKLNHEYRVDFTDPVKVSAAELIRWKDEQRQSRKLIAQSNALVRASATASG